MAHPEVRAEAERARRRAAVFGDENPVGSVDERDDADRAREGGPQDGRRWWDEQRPPHHDRA